MITYNRSAFGLNLIFRVHGSAVYRSIVPSLVSVGFFFFIRNFYSENSALLGSFGEDLGHPYAVGVLVASTTFLIVFRANQGYSRYWEAASATHHMMSKWMDATVHGGVYHMQCDHYKDIKPPSYFDYPELNHMYLTRDRERFTTTAANTSQNGDSQDELGEQEKYLHAEQPETPSSAEPDRTQKLAQARRGSINSNASPSAHNAATNRKPNQLERAEIKRERSLRSVIKSINYIEDSKKRLRATNLPKRKNITDGRRHHSMDAILHMRDEDNQDYDSEEIEYIGTSTYFGDIASNSVKQDADTKPFPLLGKPRLDGGLGGFYSPVSKDDDDDSNLVPPKQPMATFFDPANPNIMDSKGFASCQGGRTPHLFLQELAHLSSLLVAVALSTLRNDIEGAESPLAFYDPGQPWPEVDPDKDEWLKVDGLFRTIWRKVSSFLGIGRTLEEQTRYNAARPLPVIGGVSDAEIRFLQMARGPYAKTQLTWNWLSEFCIREHLAGSMGKVGPPIISRIIQFLGDGMIYYNHARKIMYIPFPFVHAQLSVLFILVTVPCIPFLMDQYTNDSWVGSLLTFFTVLCLSGIHEVARELENPFRNVPNELPLVTMQAFYNEALLTMYSGYHPDHFWNGQRIIDAQRRKQQAEKAAAKQQPPREPVSRTASAPAPSTTAPAPAKDDEIAALKQQLAEQAKWIEQLASKLNNNAKSQVSSDDGVFLETVEDESKTEEPNETTLQTVRL